MMKVTINKETISSLLFLVCALTFLSIYGGMMAFSPYEPFSIGMIIIIASAIIGFLITCALSAYGCPERKPFYIGFFFGLVPAHVISLIIGAAILGFLLGNTDFFSYIPVWGVCIFLGSAFGALRLFLSALSSAGYSNGIERLFSTPIFFRSTPTEFRPNPRCPASQNRTPPCTRGSGVMVSRAPPSL